MDVVAVAQHQCHGCSEGGSRPKNGGGCVGFDVMAEQQASASCLSRPRPREVAASGYIVATQLREGEKNCTEMRE